MKYTRHNLSKLENIFKATGYQVRYGKGNFSSGYCLLHDQKIVVVNKFYDVEARMGSLMELLLMIDIDESQLEEKVLGHYQEFMKNLEKA